MLLGYLTRGDIMATKTLGAVMLIGAIVAGWIALRAQRWDSVLLALVLFVMSIHHLTTRKHK
ncbi:MAG: hypothetical protein QXU88_02560 [Candidatus Woesearchaeota archaeon]